MIPSMPRWALPTLLGFFALLAIIYSIATPAFETPDEIWHYAVIHHIVTERALPVATTEMTAFWQQQGTQSPGYYLAAAALTAWIDQSDFPALYARQNPHAAIGVTDISGNINRMTHYADDGWPWHGALLALHIARFFSVLLGVITLWAGYHTVVPLLGPRVALIGTAVMAFTPQFVFITGAASNDNMVNAMAALVIWQLVSIVFSPPLPATHPRRFALLGVLLGIAALSKLSALGLIGLTGLVVLGMAWRARSWRIIIDAALYIGLPTALIAGWWFARNLRLYDDVLAWNMWEANISLRVIPGNALTIINELDSLFNSYWGQLGWLNLLYPNWVYAYFGVVSMLIVIGCGVALVQHRKRLLKLDAHWVAGAILLLWLLLLTVSWVRFMIVAPAAQGRYFFPAAPTLIFLMAIGLTAWRRWRIDTLVAGTLTLLAMLTPPLLIIPAYSAPPPVVTMPTTLTPVHIPFEEGITLVGIEIPNISVRPTEWITVTAAWRADAKPSRDLSVFIHLVDGDGLIAAQLDTMPGQGLSPTSEWQAGELRIDTYYVRVPRTAYTPNEGQIAIGLYDAFAADQPRQRIMEGADPGQGTIQGDSLHFGHVTILPISEEVPNKMEERFGDNVTLVGYRFSQRRIRPGDTLTVTLYWQARGAVSKQYTTFVHLLNTDFAMFGGHDGAPSTPTLEWTPGAIIEDTHTFGVSPETPPGNYQIELGLYDEEQDRLSLLTTESVQGADRLLLGPLMVVVE